MTEINYSENIRNSGLTISEHIIPGDVNLWIPSEHLETLLNARLSGFSLTGLPLRTRSKVAKEKVCEAMGYPIP